MVGGKPLAGLSYPTFSATKLHPFPPTLSNSAHEGAKEIKKEIGRKLMFSCALVELKGVYVSIRNVAEGRSA